jgi:uncharacterized protein (DUF1778 family)
MTKSRSTERSHDPVRPSPLMIRLDAESMACLVHAAELRRVSLSDYVRTVTVAQARREVLAAREAILTSAADEQLTFWNVLNETPKLTDAQQRLGATMRGER